MATSEQATIPLKPPSAFAKTRPDAVFGMLAYRGAPKSLADMDAGILKEARRRHVAATEP